MAIKIYKAIMFLDKPYVFPVNTVLKVNLKYELKNRKSGLAFEMDVKRYNVDIFFKVYESNISVTLSELNELIVNKILKQYICTIQINKIIWKYMLITNVTTKEFIARLPIHDCIGHLDLAYNQISDKHHYVYHLYKDKITPFQFSLKGVPITYMNDSTFQKKLEIVSKIFTANFSIPILSKEPQTDKPVQQQNLGFLKFVKLSTSASFSQYTTDIFQDIEMAYPWGFTKFIRSKTTSKKNSRKKNK